MRKCIECGASALKKTTETLSFNDVVEVEGIVYTCQKCGHRYEGFARVEELSREVAHHIARREERLSPEEVRFLRKYLGYSSRDLAAFLDVTPETVSRWESKTSPMQMQLSTEKFLRMMALVEKPVADYGLDRAGSTEKRAARPVFRERSGRWTAEAARR